MSEAYFKEKAACCMSEDKIDRNLFDEFGVKRGLRDFNGKGVLTGLTNISKIDLLYQVFEMLISPLM